MEHWAEWDCYAHWPGKMPQSTANLKLDYSPEWTEAFVVVYGNVQRESVHYIKK